MNAAGWASNPRQRERPSGRLTSVSCSSLRIVYFRIFCRLRLMRMPHTSPTRTTSRTPTTAAMMDVTGLGAGARSMDWGRVWGRGDEGVPRRGAVEGEEGEGADCHWHLQREFRRVTHRLSSCLTYSKTYLGSLPSGE